jgi:hypothetical protein
VRRKRIERVGIEGGKKRNVLWVKAIRAETVKRDICTFHVILNIYTAAIQWVEDGLWFG